MQDCEKPEVIFPDLESVGPREWGEELLIGIVSKKFSLKKLVLRKGAKGGLQFHHKKNEIGYLISGKMIVRFDDGFGNLKERIVNAGEAFHFPPGAVHQEEAIEDCEIIEASTPHFNDRVRVENLYGLENDHGLPSTKIEDVQEK